MLFHGVTATPATNTLSPVTSTRLARRNGRPVKMMSTKRQWSSAWLLLGLVTTSTWTSTSCDQMSVTAAPSPVYQYNGATTPTKHWYNLRQRGAGVGDQAVARRGGRIGLGEKSTTRTKTAFVPSLLQRERRGVATSTTAKTFGPNYQALPTTLLYQSTVTATEINVEEMTNAYSTITAAPMTPTSTPSRVVRLKHVDFSDTYDTRLAPAVFLHGLLGSKRNFATIGSSLVKQLDRKRRVVALDLRNHGENFEDWRDVMSYEDMAADVIAWLDEQQIAKAVLVGHSMGGKVAQALALLYPERVDGLVVLDIAPVRYCAEKDPHWKVVSDIIQTLRSVAVGPKVNRRDVDKQLRSNIPDPALRAFCLTNLDSTSGQWKIPLDAIAAQLDVLAGFLEPVNGSSLPLSSSYMGDVFFIHGGQSRFIRHAYMNTVRQFFPNHMLTTIRGAGHWVHAEAPDDTTALLKQYLDR